MSENLLKEVDTYSILIAGTVVPRPNHIPVEISLTREGVLIDIWLLRGSTFINEDGEPVTPEACISVDTFQFLSSKVDHTDEEGNTVERTLPLDWESINAMVLELRAQDTEQTEVADD